MPVILKWYDQLNGNTSQQIKQKKIKIMVDTNSQHAIMYLHQQDKEATT